MREKVPADTAPGQTKPLPGMYGLVNRVEGSLTLVLLWRPLCGAGIVYVGTAELTDSKLKLRKGENTAFSLAWDNTSKGWSHWHISENSPNWKAGLSLPPTTEVVFCFLLQESESTQSSLCLLSIGGIQSNTRWCSGIQKGLNRCSELAECTC